jgi:hypothetical protein
MPLEDQWTISWMGTPASLNGHHTGPSLLQSTRSLGDPTVVARRSDRTLQLIPTQVKIAEPIHELHLARIRAPLGLTTQWRKKMETAKAE